MNEMEFGNILYKLYHSEVKLEGAAVKDNKNCAELTVNELNLIECIRTLTKNSEGPTISSIANELDITRPSTTVAVNKLCAKKMTEKEGSISDGRSVRVKLTAKGEKAYSTHHAFQNALVKDIRQSMSEEEYKTLTASLTKLKGIFDAKLEGVSEE
ncbi:MAG: winged helix-turn-helix transcriptional regulator [Ruminiclostridium sp.]|nr:winged helix-turn-helix transcriptional regulator [Ruminiclostridium sp.]